MAEKGSAADPVVVSGSVELAVGAEVALDAATLAALESITADTELPAAAALADNQTNNDAVPQVGARLMMFDPALGWQRVRGTATNGLEVASRPVEGVVDEAGAEMAFTTVEVNATNDGSNTVIAAPGAGLKVRVLNLSLALSGAGTAQVLSGATSKMRVRAAADGGGQVVEGSPHSPVIECGTNEALIVSNPASVDSFGHVTYIVVPA